MKQYMVLMSMVVLGVYIFNLIAGNDSDSMSSCMQVMWQKGVEMRTYTP